MKKILLMMLLTFTTMTNADEGRYSMLIANNTNYWDEAVFILDTEKGSLQFCHIESKKDAKLVCYSNGTLDDPLGILDN
jgi:hypothetical protein